MKSEEEFYPQYEIEMFKNREIKKYSRQSKIARIKAFYQTNKLFFSTLSITFRLVGITFFLIIFEIAYFLLYFKIGTIFYEIWLLQGFSVSIYASFIYATLFSKHSLFLKILKIITSGFMLVIIGGLFVLVLIWFKELNTFKFILGGLTAYYLLNTVLFIKSKRYKDSKTKIKSLAIIGVLFLSSTGTMSAISLTPRTIEIVPKTEPELIFWCGSNQLPNETDVLDMCNEYHIAFMPTVREKDIGNAEYMKAYKTIIAHNISLYFVIGGNSEFFTHIDNAREFPSIYRNIRQWFINESIMESKYITSFSIDAEPSKDLTEKIHNEELLKVLNYGYKNYPSQKEINDASNALEEFRTLINENGKKCGMIQGARFLDNADRDGDMSLFLRNVYSLPLKWDFTITMLYRTNRIQYDESDDDPPEFLMRTTSLFYDALIEGTTFTTSELSFYQNVALEMNSEEDLAKEHYIFIGNFGREFKNTQYVKEKHYFMDLDICRHFKNEKVFFYDLKGFLSHYCWEGIENLGKYAQQKEKSHIKYTTYKSIIFLMFYCGLIIIDVFISSEVNLI